MKISLSAFIKRLITNIFRYILLIALAFITIFPLIWMVYSSFKTNQQFTLSALSLPSELHLENYVNAWKTANIGTYFFNSVFVCVFSIILTVVVGALGAFVLAKFTFPGQKIVSSLFVIGMLIPLQAVLVPLFSLMKNIHLLDTPWSLILVYTAFGLPITIFLMESFISSFPDSILEAAIIDGATMLRIFFTVILPMTRPVIATVAILNFLNNWKEFSFALVFINSESKKTLPLGLYNFLGAYTADYVGLMAALVIATLPVFITYLLLQEQIINGMTAGAVKG
ncbi:sugar ABC transporter permease [Treponema primitia ZAS-2]|uniref:sn-glycerol-3-phosphate transport system permease protein UgpE n=1 Tax=Treponema primitia (strain ATCC BAA-887 / DSM 12427 / ZAS-2) TaxID=545694 RepID=F5YNT4_TREPZ|nr:carbohydrate ABC transporter permease [Treponema primitia]AEF84962.1 sugar ABC transporter permease [Treponema primitia ZAS-2]